MNKDIYLEQLYIQLSKYNLDSAMKHVTEYDYIISDMLEEETMEDVLSKLGNPEELASSIAEEFNYELNDSKQYEEPIWNRKHSYTSQKNNSTIIKVINILWIIASVIFFLSFFSIIIVFVILLGFLGSINLPTMIFMALGLVFSIIFILSLYMIVLNGKNMLVNRLWQDTESVVR